MLLGGSVCPHGRTRVMVLGGQEKVIQVGMNRATCCLLSVLGKFIFALS
jgi:hypothetical protein